MTLGYTTQTPEEAVHKLKGPRMISGLRRFKWLLWQYVRPATAGKPMGVHLPDRVWQRQSALLMCLHDLQSSEKRHE